MEKFTIHLDMELETIQKGYKHYYGLTKNPTRKDIAIWISTLIEADILDCASHDDEEEETES